MARRPNLAKRPKPKTPQDLTTRTCINLRLPTHAGRYAWGFEKGRRELRVRVEGQLVFNGTAPMLEAALAGFGLAYVPEDNVQAHLAGLSGISCFGQAVGHFYAAASCEALAD